MEGGPHSIMRVLCRASQTPYLLAVSGACGVVSYMLEASGRPTRHYHYPYPYPYPYLHCVCRDKRAADLLSSTEYSTVWGRCKQ